jgi:disulfide bond formation protein DsbB
MEAGMKIIDKTPFRKEDGSISFPDRIQGTLKYGLNWYDRVMAQEKLIPVLEKHLGRSFILMRNITLGGTDVELPMILVGPPVVLLINVITEQGVFRAKEDEWGKITGDQFVPAKINHVARTARMGQVLQVFLDRAGLKGMIYVESVLFSANPGTHIESVRPIVRIVMSDALDRFAASLAQAKASLSPEMCAAVAQVTLTGKPIRQAKASASQEESQLQAEPEDNRDFFQEEQEATQGDGSLGEFTFQDDESENALETEQPAKVKPTRKKKQRIMGLSLPQLGILLGILLAWLCIVIFFFAYITAQLNV